MRVVQRRVASILFTLGLAVTLPYLTGCGGASPSTNPLGSSGNSPVRSADGTLSSANGAAKSDAERGRLGIFITATGLLPGYDRLWADIRKIELLDADEKGTILYDNTDGFLTDLNQLTDVRAPRFAPVTVGAVATAKSYTRVRVTFGKAFSLLPIGAATAQTIPLSDTVGRDAAEMPELTIPLERPRDFGSGKQNLVLAFDLTKTVVKDGRITPSLKEGKTDGIGDAGRQQAFTLTGMISELHTGEKETTFTLGFGPNRTATVTATDATMYYNATATPNPTLKEGNKIAVRGVLNPETKRLVARQIEIYGETAPPAETATLRGVVQSADAASSTLTVAPEQVSGMTPTLRAVTVQLTADAVLRGPGGLLVTSEQFFNALKNPNARLTLDGAYEPVTGVFRSAQARLADADNAPAFAALVEGTPRDASSAEGKWSVTAPTEWQGIALREGGKAVPIATTPATLYSDEKGDPMTAPAFYAALKESSHAVRALGLYANGLLAATRVELRPAPVKPEPKVADTKDGAKPEVTKSEATKTESTIRKPDEADPKKDPEAPKPVEDKKDGDAKPAPAPPTTPEPA